MANRDFNVWLNIDSNQREELFMGSQIFMVLLILPYHSSEKQFTSSNNLDNLSDYHRKFLFQFENTFTLKKLQHSWCYWKGSNKAIRDNLVVLRHARQASFSKTKLEFFYRANKTNPLNQWRLSSVLHNFPIQIGF